MDSQYSLRYSYLPFGKENDYVKHNVNVHWNHNPKHFWKDDYFFH